MDDMAHDAAHALTRSPGIGRLSTTRSDRRGSLHGYSGKWTRPVRPEGPETRGTAACCIRSKSSRLRTHRIHEGNGCTQGVIEVGYCIAQLPLSLCLFLGCCLGNRERRLVYVHVGTLARACEAFQEEIRTGFPRASDRIGIRRPAFGGNH